MAMNIIKGNKLILILLVIVITSSYLYLLSQINYLKGLNSRTLNSMIKGNNSSNSVIQSYKKAFDEYFSCVSNSKCDQKTATKNIMQNMDSITSESKNATLISSEQQVIINEAIKHGIVSENKD